MRFIACVWMSALLAGASMCRAEGLALRWDACAGEGSGVKVRSFACLENTGEDRLVGSFEPRERIPDLLGIELWVDLTTCSPATGIPCDTALPPWWMLLNSGNCRQSSLRVTLENDPANQVCQGWATAAMAGGLLAFRSPYPSSASDARVVLGAAVPAGSPAVVEPGVEYTAFTLFLDHKHTVGAGACGGCEQPVVIRFSRAQLLTSDPAHPWVLAVPLSQPGDDTVLWQGLPVPARATSWSLVKALYR